MAFAHVVDGAITAVGTPPLLVWAADQMWDLRALSADELRAAGWVEVVESPRPGDTPTDTFDHTVELIDDVPRVVWVERPKTAKELLVDQREVNERTLSDVDRAKAAITANNAFRALAAPTSAQVVAQVKLLTRQLTEVLRYEIGKVHPQLLDQVDG